MKRIWFDTMLIGSIVCAGSSVPLVPTEEVLHRFDKFTNDRGSSQASRENR